MNLEPQTQQAQMLVDEERPNSCAAVHQTSTQEQCADRSFQHTGLLQSEDNEKKGVDAHRRMSFGLAASRPRKNIDSEDTAERSGMTRAEAAGTARRAAPMPVLGSDSDAVSFGGGRFSGAF